MSDTQAQTSGFPVIVLGASAGGLAALSTILGGLPSDFRAAIAVVQHRTASPPGLLAELLGRRTALPAKDAEQGEQMEPGRVYVAPAGRHLLIHPDASLWFSDTPKVHFARPAADLLFESGAESLGDRIIAVVLTGGDSDGSDGVRSVKRMGGTVIAQDEATSEVFGMPGSAIETGDVD
jgi:two-component system, chemotaxis family, protein-glutamate methylesterase/glutaminase